MRKSFVKSPVMASRTFVSTAFCAPASKRKLGDEIHASTAASEFRLIGVMNADLARGSTCTELVMRIAIFCSSSAYAGTFELEALGVGPGDKSGVLDEDVGGVLGEDVGVSVALGVGVGDIEVKSGEVIESEAGITSDARDCAMKSALSVKVIAAAHVRETFPCMV